MSYQNDATHPASAARLQQARRDGQFAKSQELSASLQLVFSISACWLLFSMASDRLQAFAGQVWRSQRVGLGYDVTMFQEDVWQGIVAASFAILPLLGVVMVVGILAHYLQTGPIWIGKSSLPDTRRLSPANWWRQLFSFRGVARSVLGVPKLIVVLVTTALILWYRFFDLLESALLPFSHMIEALSRFVFGSCLVVGLGLLGMSLLDYVVEYVSFYRRLRMTDQQLRDEQRNQNGDPQLMGRRRRLHRQMNSSR